MLYEVITRDTEFKRDERLKMVDRYLHLTGRLELNEAAAGRLSLLRSLRNRPLPELDKGALAMLLR